MFEKVKAHADESQSIEVSSNPTKTEVLDGDALNYHDGVLAHMHRERLVYHSWRKFLLHSLFASGQIGVLVGVVLGLIFFGQDNTTLGILKWLALMVAVSLIYLLFLFVKEYRR